MLRCRTKNNWEVESTAIKVGGIDLLESKNDKRFIKFEPTTYLTYIPDSDFQAYQKNLVKLYGDDIKCDDDSCHFESDCANRPRPEVKSDLSIQVFDSQTTLKFTLNDDIMWINGVYINK